MKYDCPTIDGPVEVLSAWTPLELARKLYRRIKTMDCGQVLDMAARVFEPENDGSVCAEQWYGIKRIDTAEFDAGDTWLVSYYGPGFIKIFNVSELDMDDDFGEKIKDLLYILDEDDMYDRWPDGSYVIALEVKE